MSRLKPQPKRPAAPKRDRYQLVIALGDGDEGKRRRERLESAAAQRTLSSWARDALLAAAGAPLEGLSSRAELAEVKAQLDEVKAQLDETVMQVNKLFRMVTGRDR